MKSYFVEESLLGVVESKAMNLGAGTTVRSRRQLFNEVKRIFVLLYAPRKAPASNIIYMGYGCNSKGEAGLIVVTDEGDSIRNEQQGHAEKP